jgi:glyoxalase family protein
MTLELLGVHHLTAVSARIADNLRFYTGTLGMRLVKRSVNQDDVSAYHLFYADAVGSPGSDLTFFDWPVPPERRGTRSIVRTHLRIAGEGTLEWWARRLAGAGVETAPVEQRDGRATLLFEDPEGQRLALVDDGGAGEAHPWERSPVPAERQVRGLGPILISVPRLEPTAALLRELLHMRPAREYPLPDSPRHTVHVFAMGGGGAGAELHVAVQPDLATGRPGAGGVHHVAFRIPDADHQPWADRLDALGVPNSGKVDRFWFRSLYFREPAGILFELATDGPGFAVDEDAAALGEKVVLPPSLEPRREEIVAGLKPLPAVAAG